MCFGSKNDDHDESGARPAVNSLMPSWKDKGSSKPAKKEYHSGSSNNYSAPAPASYQQNNYAPMPAPPAVQPPAGPPSYEKTTGGTKQAPAQSQPQHDWQVAVPDTSLFPPPPDIFGSFVHSPTSNASDAEATAGAEWCKKHPLNQQPVNLDDAGRRALADHNVRLMEPAGFRGKLTWTARGHWQGYSEKKSPDRCIISYPPLYLAREKPLLGRPKTVYYEVKLLPDSPTLTLALGYAGLPYPSFRMPGWHRASLAVHGDDGHRYVHDPWGGKAFTPAFRRGETYGLGMTFRAAEHDGQKMVVDVFFTRNGVLSGGWNIHEETDAEEDQAVTGLEGLHDLCAAIGTYDGVKFEAIFDPTKWMYRDVPVEAAQDNWWE